MRTKLAILVFCTFLGSCVSTADHKRVLNANENLQRQMQELRAYQQEVDAENASLRQENAELKGRAVDAAWVEEQREKLQELLSRYEQGGTRQIPGVTAHRTPEGVSFRVQGEILFASGQNTITDGGKQTLGQVAEVLAEQGKRVRVEGHTDSDPIRRSKWISNLDLSAARAVAVAEFLKENGFPSERITIAAYGPHRPAVEGDSEEAKRQNRRVEILMLDG